MAARRFIPALISVLSLHAGAYSAAGQTTSMISVNYINGGSPGGKSDVCAMSFDGQRVAFQSVASNIIPGDTNGRQDIFVRDAGGGTVRVSVDSGGVQSNGSSSNPAVSGDGNVVAFLSDATNLVPGDTNARGDIFVHDLTTGETTRVSVDSQGNEANNLSSGAALSDDGRFVAFWSLATNLVPGDTNGVRDVFVHDRLTGVTERVSVDSAGNQATAESRSERGGALSADGRYVTFYSEASDLVPADTNGMTDAFVHDRLTGETTRVSVDSAGNEGNGGSFGPTISADGRYVAFFSGSSNLVAGDTNGLGDIFVHDRITGATTRVSVNSGGGEANGQSGSAYVSGDGRFVSFTSAADNLTPGDTNGVGDVFLHDRQTGETARVSLRWDGQQAALQSGSLGNSPVSVGGRYVAFVSDDRLVPEDTLNFQDIFQRDRGAMGCIAPSIVTQPMATAVCADEKALLEVEASGTEPLSYEWRKDGVTIPGATDPVFVIAAAQPADAGNYSARVTNACGTTNSVAAPLTVGTTILQQPSPQSGCIGGAASFSVTAVAPDAPAYQWRKDGQNIPGANASSHMIDPVGPADAGDYDVVVSSSCGDVTSNAVTLDVFEAVAIVNHPQSQIACPLGPVTLSVDAAGGGALSYQWRKDGQDLPGRTDRVLLIEHVGQQDEGDYDVVVRNECSMAVSDPATVTITTGLQIIQAPPDVLACVGQPASFAVVAQCDLPIQYQWARNSQNIPGANGPTYEIPSVALEDAAEYRVYLETPCHFTSVAADLTVREPVHISSQPESQAICQGGMAEFRVGPSLSAWNFQWRKDGEDIPGAVLRVYRVVDAQLEDAGSYDVRVDNGCSEVISDPAILTVTENSLPNITQHPQHQLACVGGLAEFTVAAEGTNLNYQWVFGTATIPGATEPTLRIDPVGLQDAGWYEVRVSNPCQSITSNRAELRIDDGSITFLQQPQNQTVCEQGQARFSVLVIGTPPFQYQWRKDGNSLPGETNPGLIINNAMAKDEGVYDVLVSSICGIESLSDSGVLVVTPYDPPVIVVEPVGGSFCAGQQAVLMVQATGAPPLSYQWRHFGRDIPGATEDTLVLDPMSAELTGEYDVLVSNPCDTASSATVRLDVDALPIITRQPIDRVVATGEGVTLTVEAAFEPLTYQWRKGGFDIPGATEATYSIPLVEAPDTGDYDVVISNACGPVVSDTILLSLVEPPRTTRISVSSGGGQASRSSAAGGMSADGRYVAFASAAVDLVPGFPDDIQNVYVHDRMAAVTRQVDLSPDGPHANAASTSGVMSRDENWVAIESAASNIVPNDTNGAADIFLFDRRNDDLRRISVGELGEEADGDSTNPSIARFADSLAFESTATNLTPGDVNGLSDVFVYSRGAGTMFLLSVGLNGDPANGPSGRPAVSDNGRFVAFESEASNLVAGDTNGAADVFLHDRDPDGNGVFDEGNGVTSLLSLDPNGQPSDGHSRRPVISSDGTLVGFESAASNLVADDANSASDVFVHDVATGATVAVSRAGAGALGNADSEFAAVSDNARFVAFSSAASDLVANDTNGRIDVFVHDRDPDNNGVFDEGNQTTVMASLPDGGPQSNGDSRRPFFSGDGTMLLFESDADNLVNNDNNHAADIFLYHRAVQFTERVSLGDGGEEANRPCRRPFLSGQRQYVFFASAADNLVPGDFGSVADIFSRNIQLDETEKWTRGWNPNGHSGGVAISADGNWVAFSSSATNLIPNDTPYSDVFVADWRTSRLEPVSINSLGEPADDNSSGPSLSSDGRFVAFVSSASNLAPNMTAGMPRVYVRDRLLGETAMVSTNDAGDPPDGQSDSARISRDGRYVAFRSVATNLVPGDTNNVGDIFVRDLAAQTTVRVSVSSSGTEGDDESTQPWISGDGSRVAFESRAANLVAGDDNGQADVFVHDLNTGQTFAASVNPDGHVGNDGASLPSISADGLTVGFISGSTDLIPFDENLLVDAFARDLALGVTRLVSVDDLDRQGDGESPGRLFFSDDGRYIAFSSNATNLIPIDTNDRTDVFIRDTDGCRAPMILAQPLGRTVFIGEQFTLEMRAAGTRPLEFQWRKDGEPLEGANDDSLTILSATPNDAGVYDVVVSNDCGFEITLEAEIEVLECSPITAYASINAPGSPAFGEHSGPALSADGRWVAFHSTSGSLVPNTSNNYRDVYVHDRHTGRVAMMSWAADGGLGNHHSAYPAISADGRFVVFQSSATNLVPDDTNGVADVFLRDRDPDGNGVFDDGNDMTTRVSLSSGGQQATRDCHRAAISADGRIVAFVSQAFGAPGSIDQIYVHDTQTGQTTRVSIDASGLPANDDCTWPTLSADGRFVAFWSRASNLDPADTNIHPDIFVHDRQTGTTRLASVDNNGNSVTGDNLSKSRIAASGRFVVFASQAPLAPGHPANVRQVYVRDLIAGTTTPVSRDSNGAWANGHCTESAISADGRFITFYSVATNLAPDDTNNASDAFLHDRVTGETRLISRAPDGAVGDERTGASTGHEGIAMSNDGYYAAFFSLARNLEPNHVNQEEEDVFVYTRTTDRLRSASNSGGGLLSNDRSEYASVSGDGRYVAFESIGINLVPGDTNNSRDIFLHDRYTGLTQRVNRTYDGQQTPLSRDSRNGVVSADGRWIAFSSSAENIVQNDVNGRDDVFVMSTELEESAVLVSVSSSGVQGNGDSGNNARNVAISADGRFVAFTSRATNLAAGDTNGQPDIYVRDRDPDGNGVFDEGNGVTFRASRAVGGPEPTSFCEQPQISADGRFTAFQCGDGQLLPGGNFQWQIYVFDRLNGTLERVSANSLGETANMRSTALSMTPDGRYVAFASEANNLDPIDPDTGSDIFIRDRQTQTTFLASLSHSGGPASGGSVDPAISGDGRFVAFSSAAADIVVGDTNGVRDIFVRDLQAEQNYRVSVSSNGVEGTADADHPAISGDGGLVAFQGGGELFPGHGVSTLHVATHLRTSCLEATLIEQPSGLVRPPGAPAQFEVIATGNPPPTFQWRKDGLDIFGAADRTLTIDRVNPAHAGQYDVVVTNPQGSTISDPATLRVAGAGDLNCDGSLDAFDIEPFIVALTDPNGYAVIHPECDRNLADANGDGSVDAFDIESFINLLIGP